MAFRYTINGSMRGKHRAHRWWWWWWWWWSYTCVCVVNIIPCIGRLGASARARSPQCGRGNGSPMPEVIVYQLMSQYNDSPHVLMLFLLLLVFCIVLCVRNALHDDKSAKIWRIEFEGFVVCAFELYCVFGGKGYTYLIHTIVLYIVQCTGPAMVFMMLVI